MPESVLPLVSALDPAGTQGTQNLADKASCLMQGEETPEEGGKRGGRHQQAVDATVPKKPSVTLSGVVL